MGYEMNGVVALLRILCRQRNPARPTKDRYFPNVVINSRAMNDSDRHTPKIEKGGCTQGGAARPPPPHLCRGWVGGFEAPIQISCYIFKNRPSGRKRPFFLMARLCSFFALLWFALLFDLCGLRLKIRCYSAFSFLGTLVQFYPKKYPRTLNGHNFRPSMTH